MPRRTVLSAAQRASFERLPTQPDELVKYYTLNQEDIRFIRKRRRAMNRLGFAIQLCLVGYPGRVLRSSEQLPPSFIAFIADQTDTTPSDFVQYAKCFYPKQGLLHDAAHS